MAMFPLRRSKGIRYLALVACLTGVIAVLIFVVWRIQMPPSDKNELASYVQEAISLCSTQRHTPSCYEEKLPDLVGDLSLQDAFEVVRMVQQQDESFVHCHVVAHEIAARETAKDPSRWKEVVAQSPSGVCSNGSIHGAFQERFRMEQLTEKEFPLFRKEVEGVCQPNDSWNPSLLDRSNCYHALGHLLVYAADARLDTALTWCDELVASQQGVPDSRSLCYDGLFMQVFQPLEPEDIELVEGVRPSSSDAVGAFCSGFSSDEQRASCSMASWIFFEEQLRTPREVEAFCSSDPVRLFRERCYEALFDVIAPRIGLDVATLTSFCGGMDTMRDACFAAMATRFVEENRDLIDSAVALCEAAASHGGSNDICLQRLVFYASFSTQEDESQLKRYCTAMPPDWQGRCMTGTGI